VGQIVEKYVIGGRPVQDAHKKGRRSINEYAKSARPVQDAHKKDFKRYIMADVREEHHFKRNLIHIQLDELFQLFNQCDLNKSIIASYCL
jgi:hypothetical protein